MSTQVREQTSRLEMKSVRISNRPLGLSPGEMVAAGLALIYFLVTVGYFFYYVKPERERLETAKKRQAELQQRLIELQAPPKESETAAPIDTAAEAINSLDAFRSQYLKPLAKSRIDLINEVNALAKKHGVQLTGGISMKLEEKAEEEPEQQRGSGKKKQENLLDRAYPKLDVHFEVAGQYSNLRTFINELEHTKHLLIIHEVKLAVKDREDRRGPQGQALSIDLTAYFRP